ncbi:MAG: gliding motility-associated ABC transporter substrate-binding protein GldG [Leadbetterella sp.]|nr:gliding motility-associated ABC transporter substrate-binding protein GldG [Leadbetterella sp.]
MVKRAALIGGILLLNLLSFYVYFRWDLTEDKRYSIAPATRHLLEDLDTPVEITVYLEGNSLPGGFERLRRAVKETLAEFRYYAGRNIFVRYVDPEKGSDAEKKARFADFQKKGILPTNVFDQKGGRKSEIPVFPYAVVSAEGKQDVVLLLKSNQVTSVTAEEKLNQSYENVEYELAASIQKLTATEKKNVGLLYEFTSRSPLEFRGMIDALKERYNLFIIDAKASRSFDGLDALIIPAPDKPVDDSTKFKIDQFIMSGGNALFFVDGLKVDSIGLEGTYAQPLDVNLDDLLFNYGLRVNKNIVKDGLNSAVIPLVVGKMGDEPNIQPVVYRYFPLINNFGNSLITKNIGMVLTKYAATIDTVNAGDGLKKTPLLLTSPHTQVLNAPALITFNEARKDTDEAEYKNGVKAVGYLVEGKFRSLYRNRLSGNVIRESKPAKILVVSDGDVIQNETNPEKGTFYPLGFDKYFKHWYGNEDFLLNALNYLTDSEGILLSRTKTVGMRPLDALKIRDKRTQIQLLNIVLPLAVLLVFGLVRYVWIRKKYTMI